MATDDFFRARLDAMIDLKHPLAVLATRLPWAAIEVAVAPELARQVLPQVHIGIAGQDLAAEGVGLGLAAPGIVFHAKQYAQALYASGSREWQGKGGRITPAAA